jgi:apoptosis-inducing factor 2
MTESFPARPTVVVLGGGYAGIQVAQPLDDLADVVLVEPRDDFVHNVAALRALVEPSWLERIYLPYTRLLRHGRVTRDRAVKADADRVVLASGTELFPDHLVLATGSGYPFPAKSDRAGRRSATEDQADVGQQERQQRDGAGDHDAVGERALDGQPGRGQPHDEHRDASRA